MSEPRGAKKEPIEAPPPAGGPAFAFVRWRWLGLGALGAALAWVYGRLVVDDPLLARDDQRLVSPLAQLRSLADYLSALREGRILDLQPVRDLSFLLDLWLRDLTGRGTFHLTNLVLWCAIVWAVHRLLRQVVRDDALRGAFAALFALHPAFVNAVAWVAARKHLLAALFILAATLIVVEAPKRLGKSRLAACVLLFALSVLSQPITLLWPLWAAGFLAWRRGSRGEALRLGLLCLPLLLGVAAANYLYYTGAFIEQTGSAKFTGSDEGAAVSLLALGRYFMNLAFPSALATSYYPGSTLNVVGLVLFVPFCAASAKWRPAARPWLAFFLFPLVPVTLRMTNIFVSDSYLIVPGAGALLAAAGWLPADAASPRRRVAGMALVVLLAVACVPLAHRQARTWASDAALWAHAVAVEPTPNALAKHAFFLAQAGNTAEAIEHALRLGDWEPQHPEYPFVLSKAVYLDKALSADQKLALLETRGVGGPWVDYHAAWLLASLERFVEAHARLQRALGSAATFKGELSSVAAEAELLCEKAQAPGCADATATLRQNFAAVWSEQAYAARRKSLGR